MGGQWSLTLIGLIPLPDFTDALSMNAMIHLPDFVNPQIYRSEDVYAESFSDQLLV